MPKKYYLQFGRNKNDFKKPQKTDKIYLFLQEYWKWRKNNSVQNVILQDNYNQSRGDHMQIKPPKSK